MPDGGVSGSGASAENHSVAAGAHSNVAGRDYTTNIQNQVVYQFPAASPAGGGQPDYTVIRRTALEKMQAQQRKAEWCVKAYFDVQRPEREFATLHAWLVDYRRDRRPLGDRELWKKLTEDFNDAQWHPGDRVDINPRLEESRDVYRESCREVQAALDNTLGGSADYEAEVSRCQTGLRNIIAALREISLMLKKDVLDALDEIESHLMMAAEQSQVAHAAPLLQGVSGEPHPDTVTQHRINKPPLPKRELAEHVRVQQQQTPPTTERDS